MNKKPATTSDFVRRLKITSKAYTVESPTGGTFHVVFRDRFVSIRQGRRRRVFGPLNSVQRPNEGTAKIAVLWYLEW